MIERQREEAHRPDGDEVAVVRLDDHRTLLHAADAENRDLRLIDDGRPEKSAEDAGVRDRERPALHVFGTQFLGPRAFAQVINYLRQAEDVFSSAFLMT